MPLDKGCLAWHGQSGLPGSLSQLTSWQSSITNGQLTCKSLLLRTGVCAQVWRGRGDPCDELYEMLRPKLDRVPHHFKQARNYHIGVHPLHPPLRLLRALRQVRVRHSWTPCAGIHACLAGGELACVPSSVHQPQSS